MTEEEAREVLDRPKSGIELQAEQIIAEALCDLSEKLLLNAIEISQGKQRCYWKREFRRLQLMKGNESQ